MKLAKRLMMRHAGPTGPWSIMTISATVGLDASDADSITLNGATVSQWADKSGNERHATQTVTNRQPVRSNNGIVFTDDSLLLPTAAFPSAGHTIMALMASSTTGNSSVGLININASDDPELRIGVGDNVLDYFNGGYALNSAGAGCTTLGIVSVEHSAGPTASLRKNGHLIAEATRAGELREIATFSLGYYARIPGYRNGTIHELFVFPTNAQSRQQAEGYIAHKWDAILGGSALVTALPSDHPYKTTAP